MRKEAGSEFVFVTHYPSRKRPFYAMESAGNPEETESVDLLFRGLEITTGGQRIHSNRKQTETMKRRRINTELFWGMQSGRKSILPAGSLCFVKAPGMNLARVVCRCYFSGLVSAVSSGIHA